MRIIHYHFKGCMEGRFSKITITGRSPRERGFRISPTESEDKAVKGVEDFQMKVSNLNVAFGMDEKPSCSSEQILLLPCRNKKFLAGSDRLAPRKAV